MRPVSFPLLLLFFVPLHSTVVDTLLSFNGIARKELMTATSNPIVNAKEELVTTRPLPIVSAEEEPLATEATDESPFGLAKEPVSDVNATEDVFSTSTHFPKVKVNFAIL